MPRCLISLGSNLGERRANLHRAVELLAATANVRVERVSPFCETTPIGGPSDQPPFLNAAAVLETSLLPRELLVATQSVEQALGRVRAERWGPRSLDIDLLLYDSLELDEPDLTIPHPRLAVRRFMLEPAAAIAADWIYPVNGWTVEKLLTNLSASPRHIALYSATKDGAKLLADLVTPSLNATWRLTALGSSGAQPPARVRFAVIFVPDTKANSVNGVVQRLREVCHTAEMCPALWIHDKSLEPAASEVLAACRASE